MIAGRPPRRFLQRRRREIRAKGTASLKRRDRNKTPATAAWRRWPPGAVALMAQAAAWVVAAPGLVLAWPTAVVLGIQAVVAFVVSRALRQPLWWQLINAAFFPVIGLARHLTIHPGWYLAGFAVLALTSLGSLRTRVPLYLSSSAAVDAVVQRLPERPGLKVIDLGCGLGGWLLRLKAARPDLVASGVEMAPLNFLVSRLRLSRRAEVRLGSIWETDLSDTMSSMRTFRPRPCRACGKRCGARCDRAPCSSATASTFPASRRTRRWSCTTSAAPGCWSGGAEHGWPGNGDHHPRGRRSCRLQGACRS
jgi:hypothetical protein